jgi:hypothetical protein
MGDVTHYFDCLGCGRPITVMFRPMEKPYDPKQLREFSCPHGCGTVERRDLHGRIIDVWAGHSPTRT